MLFKRKIFGMNKMDKLFKKLLLIRTISIIGWDFQTLIQKLFDSGNLELVKGGFCSHWDNWKVFDLKNKSIWSSWNDCVSGKIELEDNEIIVNFTIWNKEYSSCRPDENWIAKFKLINFDKEKFLSFFIQEISVKWRNHLLKEFEKEEEVKKQKRLLQIEAYLLR